MGHLVEIKIPLMTEDGLCYFIFKRSEFGDPYSVTIELPEFICKKRKMQLPKKWFAKELLEDLIEV